VHYFFGDFQEFIVLCYLPLK